MVDGWYRLRRDSPRSVSLTLQNKRGHCREKTNQVPFSRNCGLYSKSSLKPFAIHVRTIPSFTSGITNIFGSLIRYLFLTFTSETFWATWFCSPLHELFFFPPGSYKNTPTFVSSNDVQPPHPMCTRLCCSPPSISFLCFACLARPKTRLPPREYTRKSRWRQKGEWWYKSLPFKEKTLISTPLHRVQRITHNVHWLLYLTS